MKIIFRTVFAAVVAIAFSSTCVAQEVEQKVEKFISMLKAGKSTEAVDYIYSGNPWTTKSSDAVQNVRSQLASINKIVGELRNYEKLQDLAVGTRFRYLTYLAAYDRQPIRLNFEFYKPEDTWMIFSFSLDTKLDDDVERIAKDRIAKP